MSRNAYSDIKCCWTASLAKQNDQYLKKLGWYSYLPVHHFSQCIILNDEFQPAFPFIWLLSRPDSMLRSPLKCRWSLPYLIPSSFCFSVFLQVCLGEGDGTPLQYSCLENPMGGGAWWAAVHGVAKSRTWLSDFPFTFHFHALEKEMATHSSVLAWRIPGTGSLVGCRLWGRTESDTTEVT